MNKRSLLRLGVLAACAVWAVGGVQAQSYPTKAIRLIVPFPAGGATDLFARTLSQKLGEKLGQSMVVENRPGAGGTLGADLAAKASPDGYTVLLSTSSTHSIGPNLNPRMPYDAVRDFTPIGHLGNAPSIMLVPNNSPAKTVKEWIDYAKKNPGRLNYASSGNGTIVQLSAELFKAQADVFVVHFPYKGTALAIPDLITGKVDVLFDSLSTGMPHVRDGRLRALGVTTLKPTALAPGMAPIADVLPGYESNTWFGLFGPKKKSARRGGHPHQHGGQSSAARPRSDGEIAALWHRACGRHTCAIQHDVGQRIGQMEKDHHRTQDHLGMT